MLFIMLLYLSMKRGQSKEACAVRRFGFLLTEVIGILIMSERHDRAFVHEKEGFQKEKASLFSWASALS